MMKNVAFSLQISPETALEGPCNSRAKFLKASMMRKNAAGMWQSGDQDRQAFVFAPCTTPRKS
jgi:hypothetical protein